MSLLATLALAASGVTVPVCSWDHPGVNPFMGDVVAAVDRYTDIPAATRAKLKARMERRDYDEVVLIERERITGKAEYASDITGMHFGQSGICNTVSRKKWSDQMQERGLVYCEDGQCILVPTICRNVSRIRRTGEAPLVIAPAAGAPPAEGGDQPLAFEPPGAGPAAPAPPGSFSNPTPLTAVPLAFVPSITPPIGGGPTTAPPNVPPLSPPPILPPGNPNTPTPAVPEPSTWLTMLAGLAAVAAVTRRRSAR